MNNIYTIPARDVVPGMLFHDIDNELFRVSLPGPSPRELCCTCDDWQLGHGADCHGVGLVPSAQLAALVPPADHGDTCPVAPVTGLHGGMRLWPAPFNGRAWREFAYEGLNGWLCDTPTPHSKDTVVFPVHLGYPMSNWASGHGDMIRQCFYLPPATPPAPTGDRAAWEAARARKGYR